MRRKSKMTVQSVAIGKVCSPQLYEYSETAISLINGFCTLCFSFRAKMLHPQLKLHFSYQDARSPPQKSY